MIRRLAEFRIGLLLGFIAAMGIIFKLEMLVNICPSMRHTIVLRNQTYKWSPGTVLNDERSSPHPILNNDQGINPTMYKDQSLQPTLNHTQNNLTTTPSSKRSQSSTLKINDQTNTNNIRTNNTQNNLTTTPSSKRSLSSTLKINDQTNTNNIRTNNTQNNLTSTPSSKRSLSSTLKINDQTNTNNIRTNNTQNNLTSTPSSKRSLSSTLKIIDQTNTNKFSQKDRIKTVMKERSRGTGHVEESCDIETALLFLKSNNNTSIETYADPFEGMSPTGGRDWSFNSTVSCVHMNSTNFPLHSVGKGRAQLIPRCSKDDISLIKNANSNKSFPVFEFPDKCLEKIIDKFCSKEFVVPNILHYIWFGKQNFEFMYFVAIYSAYKIQTPCFIFVYYDIVPKGVWWDLLLLSVTNIVQVKMDPPAEISGKKIVYVQHKADIVRLQILREYGGIYSDTDQIILRPLDNLRNNECTMGMAEDGYLGSALILARRNSTFINKWIASYSSYNPNHWGGNSVIMATKLSKQYPDSIHVHAHYCVFYPPHGPMFDRNYKWSHSYAFHIYKQGRMEQLTKMNFSSIRKVNGTIGAIYRFVLFGSKEVCL